MNKQVHTGIKRLVLILVSVAAVSLAHGGFIHVRGTVVSATSDAITVKTATGNVTVKLDGKTQFFKNDQKGRISDVVPGARVIVEAPEAKDKAAHSVKVGTAAGAQTGKK